MFLVSCNSNDFLFEELDVALTFALKYLRFTSCFDVYISKVLENPEFSQLLFHFEKFHF